MHTASPVFDAGKVQSLPYNPMTLILHGLFLILSSSSFVIVRLVLKTFESNFSLKHF